MSDNGTQASIVEALILASPEPLAARKIAEVVEDLRPSKVGAVVSLLNERYAGGRCAYRIRELAGGYQFYILPQFTGYVEELFARRRKLRLTRAALETLAVVAYRQPVTKTDIEHIRGVASDGVIHNLLEKNMITVKGRANTVGKPLQYGTTDEFLKFFGLVSLDDLPKMSEIEQLIADSQNEQQVDLILRSPLFSEKLNVADGTYDPAKSQEPGEPDDGSLTGTNEATDSTEADAKAASESEGQSREAGVVIEFDDTSRE